MNKKFKFASAILSASLLITPVSGLVNSYDSIAKAEEKHIKVNKKEIINQLNKTDNNILGIKYKENLFIELPNGYNKEIIKNPVTNEKYIKIFSKYESRGIKSKALVYSLRYGGKGLSYFLEYIGDKTIQKYIKRNSSKIADVIDSVAHKGEAYLIQGLVDLGMPISYARNISWVVVNFFL